MANIRGREILYDGKIYSTYTEIAEVAEVPYQRMMKKIRNGLSPEDAVLEIKIYDEEREKKRKSSNTKEILQNESADIQQSMESVINKLVSEPKKSIDETKDKFIKIEPQEKKPDPEVKVEVKPVKFDNEIPVDAEEPIKEDVHATCSRPNYKTIEGPAEAVAKIKELGVSTINLIDYENICGDKTLLKKYINKKDTINIFFYNATQFSNQFFNIIKGCTNYNLQVHIFECRDQLVDRLITYYLGYIDSSLDDKNFNIISKDTGFYAFISSLGNSRINGVGINYIENKELRYKYSLCKYIANNKLFNHRDCITTREIAKLFEPFYNRNLSNADVDDLLNSLVKFKVASIINKGNFTWCKFNMAAIKDFLEEYKW